MTSSDETRVATASREIAADAATIFELIADVFVMNNSSGRVRENHVVEFEEGRLVAWRPAEPGKQPPGHLWKWELSPLPGGGTRVTHTYDWTQLTDSNRLPRARATTSDKLMASIDRLAELAEG